MITIKMTGIQDAKRALRALGPAIQKNVITKATRTAATVIAQEVRRTAPRNTGKLKRLIRTSKASRSGPQRRLNIVVRSGDVVYVVYPDADAFYALFLEYGTSKTPARPFMRPAFDQSVGEAIARFQERVIAGVIIEAQKIAKRKAA